MALGSGGLLGASDQCAADAAVLVAVRPPGGAPTGTSVPRTLSSRMTGASRPPGVASEGNRSRRKPADGVRLRVLDGEEPFLSARGPVPVLDLDEGVRARRGPSARLAAPQAAASAARLLELPQRDLAKVARSHPVSDEPRRDVALDPLDPDPGREVALELGEDAWRRSRSRTARSRPPSTPRTGPSRGARASGRPSACPGGTSGRRRSVGASFDVALRVHPGQAEHHVVDDLQPPVPRLARRGRHVVDPVGAVDALEDLLGQALDADLDPRHAARRAGRGGPGRRTSPVGSPPSGRRDGASASSLADAASASEADGAPIEARRGSPGRPTPGSAFGRAGNVPPITITSTLLVGWPIVSSDRETVLGDRPGVPAELGAPQGDRLLAGVALRASELDARPGSTCSGRGGRRPARSSRPRSRHPRACASASDGRPGRAARSTSRQGVQPLHVRGDGPPRAARRASARGSPRGRRRRGRGVPVRVDSVVEPLAGLSGQHVGGRRISATFDEPVRNIATLNSWTICSSSIAVASKLVEAALRIPPAVPAAVAPSDDRPGHIEPGSDPSARDDGSPSGASARTATGEGIPQSQNVLPTLRLPDRPLGDRPVVLDGREGGPARCRSRRTLGPRASTSFSATGERDAGAGLLGEDGQVVREAADPLEAARARRSPSGWTISWRKLRWIARRRRR